MTAMHQHRFTAHGEPDRRLSVAPMMDYTTRDFRYLCRLISRHTLLYTEMVTAQAIHHGDREKLLGFDALEHPVAAQLGGSDPKLLAEAARVCTDFGYDEINLNVGCPSDRVQSGRFGACLMAEPELVGRCVAAMADATGLPVTVKTRIGIDDRDDYPFLHEFVSRVRDAGCRTFIIHARKAVLGGLSPRENREIPPLQYDRARMLRTDFPDCQIILNGGIQGLDQACEHLRTLDGVMIGREIWRNPWMLVEADRRIFGDTHPLPCRHEVIEAFLPWVERRFAAGIHPKHVLRHVLNLFQGIPGARAFRRHISENAHKPGATPRVLEDALAKVPREREAPSRAATANA